MFKRSLTLAAVAGALSVGLITPALAAPNDFVGTWVNKNPNTNSVTKFVITSAGSNTLKIQVFGKCHPSDCDWGSTSMLTYGLNVQDTNHTYATATYNKGFANSFLTMGLANNEIMLQNFTQFVDNSGRQNYYNREYFERIPQVSLPLPIKLPIIPR